MGNVQYTTDHVIIENVLRANMKPKEEMVQVQEEVIEEIAVVETIEVIDGTTTSVDELFDTSNDADGFRVISNYSSSDSDEEESDDGDGGVYYDDAPIWASILL